MRRAPATVVLLLAVGVVLEAGMIRMVVADLPYARVWDAAVLGIIDARTHKWIEKRPHGQRRALGGGGAYSGGTWWTRRPRFRALDGYGRGRVCGGERQVTPARGGVVKLFALGRPRT